jgi:hypothetical protein
LAQPQREPRPPNIAEWFWGRYRLARLDGTPFRIESSIFPEAQLRLTTDEAHTKADEAAEVP